MKIITKKKWILKKEKFSETTFEGPTSVANLEAKGQKYVFKKIAK